MPSLQREAGKFETVHREEGRRQIDLVKGQPLSVPDLKALYQIPVRTLPFCVDFCLLCPPTPLPQAKPGSSLPGPLLGGRPSL